MEIYSPAFKNGERIPMTYTCDGEHFLSPPLAFENVPSEAKSLVLIVEDPDVPKHIREDQLFVHWVLFNIPPETTCLGEGEQKGIAGANTRGEARYTGPCPPPEYEPSEHRYIFTLYVLDTELSLSEGASKEEVLAGMSGHVLERAEVLGKYRRSTN